MRLLFARVADIGNQRGMHAPALHLAAAFLLILAMMFVYFRLVNTIGHGLPGKAVQNTGGSIDHVLRRMNDEWY